MDYVLKLVEMQMRNDAVIPKGLLPFWSECNVENGARGRVERLADGFAIGEKSKVLKTGPSSNSTMYAPA
jgi:hypothetical protein